MKIQLSDHFTYRRLFRFVLPSVVMMIFTSIYGVVDGIFVSNFAGKTPLSAINLIWPYIMLFGSFGFLLGTGGTALISKTMGMGKHREANEIFSLLVWTAVIGGTVLTAVALLLLRPVATAVGASGQMLEDCVTYGRIVLPATTAYVLQFAFQSFCVAAEKANLSLITTVVSGVCNILLDTLFVAVFPWGLKGAAAATAIAQVVGAVIPMVYFARPNRSLLRLCRCSFNGGALLRTLINGSSELMTNISVSLVGMLYNIQLMVYAGEDGVAAYGVIMYVNLFFLSVFIGYALGAAPLIGFNYGADNRQELKNLFRKSIVILSVSSLLMTGSAILLARPLSGVFVGYDPALMEMTVRGFTLYALSFLFSGFGIFGSAMFTSLNNGLVSAVISFLRTLVFQLMAVFLLPLVLKLDGIWLSVVVAEFAALLVTAFCFVKFRKRYHYI